MSNQRRGRFITFEGIDGSGKSTQLELLAKALEAAGREGIITRNPGGTGFGLGLRQILLHHPGQVFPISELLLFIADRAMGVGWRWRQFTRSTILPSKVKSRT